MKIGKPVLIIFLALCLLLAAATSGCNREERKQLNGLPEGEPSDYFPIDVGAKWVYEIEIGQTEPLRYWETSWPVGDGRLVYATWARFPVLLEEESPKKFMLETRVKRIVSEQGPFKHPIGVELAIEKDELGIFEDAKQVFWSIIPDRFMAHEVITYSPDIPGAPRGPWGTWGHEDGYSMRLLFFAESPGTRIGMGEEPKDTLLFIGVDTRVPSYEGMPLLHFVRKVERSEESEEPKSLEKAFSEDTWFARGKGMVRLEQRVEDKISMTWVLRP